mmetsp:Transcript_105155/g.322399  ORF Transcript_105155/g.322399 Transcript_105155/m.322399 type:complete len:325 (-) Transcript_105155:1255-2229(-)
MVDNCLVAPGVRFFVLPVLDVNVGHRRLGRGELGVVRLHRPEHVQRLVDVAFLDRQLAIGDQHFDFLGRAGKLRDGVLHDLGGSIQALHLREQPDEQRQQRGAVGNAEHHHLVLRHLGVCANGLDAGQLHRSLEHLHRGLVLARGAQHLRLDEVVQRVVPHAEVVAQPLLQVLQRGVRLVLAVVDARQEQVGVRVRGVQPQARVEDPRGHLDFVQGHLRLRKEDLRWHEPGHESRERLEHLDPALQVAARLGALGDGRADGVLQVLTGDIKHEVCVEFDEEVVAHSRLEGRDVQSQGLVQQPQRRIHVPPLPPRQQGLQEREVG